MDGYAHPEFAAVEATFRNQLDKTNGGAAVAVYHRGEKVVDLWGGSRTNEGDPWTEDTIAMCYSTTKGVASFALHLQVEAGLVSYDEPVATYWPEFAQNGKEGVTVRHVLSHSAGLHRVRSVVERAHHMLDWDHMVNALAQEPPAYEPGTKCGYHAMTYGWLVGEIVRRVTGKDLGEVVADSIATPLGLDGLYLGCPPEERHRVAPLEPMTSGRQLLPKRMRGVEKKIGEQFAKGLSLARSPINPRRMINALIPRGMEDIIASPELMDAEVPAVNGFFSARSLAAMYGVLAGRGQLNGVRLLAPELVDQIGEVQISKRDLVLVVPMKWRLGYHRLMTSKGPSDTGFGHFGFGGSGGWADPTKDLAVAMVCNRGNGTPVGDMRLMRLSTAAYESVEGRSAAVDESAA
ncbi:MAG TPA: serine hydrolase domain-containing protein [Acidimicrobiales bacterium]|nr:serine hydrolase domain-containing protein [Acidimicrobiales bacterium]